MNETLIRSAWRERLSNPIRLGSLCGVFVLPLVTTIIDPDPQLAEAFWAALFAAVLGTGIIGLEISSGSLSLVLTRPISRRTYVLSRWIAVALLATGLSIAQLSCQALIIRFSGHELPLELFLFDAADRASLALGVAAAFVFLSTIGASVADLFLWAGLNVLAGVLQTAGKLMSIPLLGQGGRLFGRIANPHVDVYRLLFSTRVPWLEALQYLAILTFALAAATVVLNRRELSYASD